MSTQAPCLICGNDRFTCGPNGRLSPDGLPPRCTRCDSLERHRVIRSIWDGLRPLFPLDTFVCLQFAKDASVYPAWFKEYHLSVYGGSNSLDLQDINLPDAVVDVVVCNHVLEHVADDRNALREMMRIVRPNGFLQLAVPSPLYYESTEDWGYPDKNLHYHYRNYGRDMVGMLAEVLPGAYLLTVVARDYCTDLLDSVFLLSHAPITRALTAVFPQSHFQRLEPGSIFDAKAMGVAHLPLHAARRGTVPYTTPKR